MSDKAKQARPNLVIKNLTIDNGYGGVAGSLADAEIDGLTIKRTKHPIVLNSMVRSTMKNVDIETAPEGVRPARKFFGGFSFKNGDHLKEPVVNSGTSPAPGIVADHYWKRARHRLR